MPPRVSIPLDEDVVEKLRELAKERGRQIDALAHEALRSALGIPTPPFRVEAKALGLRPGFSLECIAQLLDEVEGPERR